MSLLLQDLKYALRRLFAEPAFTAVAVLTLGLGIGANTAIFSVLHAVLLRSLPVREPERLVLWTDAPDEGTMEGSLITGRWEYFTFPVYRNYREHLKSLSGLAALRSLPSPLSIVGETGESDAPAQMGTGQLVSGNYFSVLGATALLGRTLTPADDAPGAPPAAVVSYGYWQTRLGGEPTAVGRTVQLNGTAVTIIGVMGREFFGERLRRPPDYWVPLQLQPRIELTNPYFDDQTVYCLRLIGRLAPGATLAAAQDEANGVLRQFLTQQQGGDASAEIRQQIAGSYVTLLPGLRGVSGLRSRYQQSLYVLAAVVAVVLLIACANIANLLLARAAQRYTEITVRLALGATQGRLARQLLTEGLVLALAGGVVGLLISAWGASLLVASVAPTAPVDLSLSPLVLGFTAAVSLAAGVLFSLAPALRSTRLDLASALKERASTGGPRRRVALAPALVVAQVALCLVLLMGAGLLTRSLVNLEGQDFGFSRSGVLLVRLQTRLAGYKPVELEGLYRRLLDQLATVPGATSTTVASYSPMGHQSRTSSIVIQSYEPKQNEDMTASVNLIGPRWPETMGVAVRQGRAFGDGDRTGAPKVALVNEAFVRAYFPGQNPLGRRLGFGNRSEEAGEYEIVGVLGDARFAGADEVAGRMVYLPMLQASDESAYPSELAVRVSGDPAASGPAVRAAVAAVDPHLPISEMIPIEEQVGNALFQQRLFARLVGIFGIVAVALACVGLYGVVGQSVARRTQEVGIRMALGADQGRILRMVLQETLLLIGGGLVIGVPAALAGAQLIRGQLYGVGTADPVTLLLTSALLVGVAAVAGYLPARRASSVAPMVALRRE